MYINQIDDLFDVTLNKLNIFLNQKKSFQKLSEDNNFVKFQNNIIDLIKQFVKTLPEKEIMLILKDKNNYKLVIEIIKRYCAYYIYLGIAYYYDGGRDLFITNMIESSKIQKDLTYQIQNFYNSENNSKIVKLYYNIKNIISLVEFKTMDRIKIVLSNNPIKFESTILLFNNLGEDYVSEYFLVKNNRHNIIKTIIFRQIYLLEEKNDIVKMLEQEEKDNSVYRYIEVTVSKEEKLVDFSVIQKFLTIDQIKHGMAEEIYTYLEEIRELKEKIIRKSSDYINFLFSKNILIPITEDFLRFHKDSEKYETGSKAHATMKDREATKIKYIINKMNKVMSINSEMYKQNPKLKLDALNYFYKSLSHREAVLYNEDEEVKIINKLRLSEKATDIELLVDLENIRKYSYVNYKDFGNDGFKLRTKKQIQGIRYTNIKHRDTNENKKIELRIGHDNLSMNVIGIIINPSNIPLECFQIKQLVDVTQIIKSENGYESFSKVLANTFNEVYTGTDSAAYKKRVLFYWLFDTKKDTVTLDKYRNVSSLNVSKNIKIMISEIYNQYIRLVENKIHKYINNLKEINIWNLENLLKNYKRKFLNFNYNPELKNKIISNALLGKLLELKIIEDEVDNLIPGKRSDLIRLPQIKIKETDKTIIILKEEKEENDEILLVNPPICYHHIKWKNITRMPRSKSDEQNQAIFDYVKQYVKLNKRGDYTCKSCGELLYLKKYVYEGTYVKELDVFLTTSLAVKQNLHKIPKYSKLTRTIRNIEKNIEKICFLSGLDYYLGNIPVILLRRKTLVKDIIDLILIHTEYLKKNPKERIRKASEKYNINKDLTNLFFFPLKDEIFLASSTDTDYYKLIKFNNVIAYIIFILITEMNSGQILGLKDDKKCNFFLFSKLNETIFSKLFIRLNRKEKISLMKLPLLSYVIFYFSCILTSNYIWLWNRTDDKKGFNYNIQQVIIHTLVDMINSIVEANLEKDKDYLYEIISTRLTFKITQVYTDTELYKRVENLSMKKIRIDSDTKKVTFILKKIKTFNLSGKYLEHTIPDHDVDHCESTTGIIDQKEFILLKNKLDILTNCPDGKFHSWKFVNDDLICQNCNQKYSYLLGKINTTSPKYNNDILNNIKVANLRKLASTYCISGEIHQLDPDTNKCVKCDIDPSKHKYTDKELKRLERNLKEKRDEDILKQINLMKQYYKEKEQLEKKISIIMKKFNERYQNNTNNKIINYVDDFIKKMSKILGKKIKVDNKVIYLNETIYKLDHDYLGNPLKNVIIVSSKEDKIKLLKNNPFFKKDILYYLDKVNKVYVYYDVVTKQYLGYSHDKKNINQSRTNANIKVVFSIKDMIMLMGLTNEYENIYHIDTEFQKMSNDEIIQNTQRIVSTIIRNRISNLKQIIYRSQSLIHGVRNHYVVRSLYGVGERKIINQFTKVLKKFNIKDDEGHKSIFKHSKYILSRLEMDYVPDNIIVSYTKNYLDVSIINKLNNIDSKLIFYLIFNFERLLEYNTIPSIKFNLGYFIIQIIQYLFKTYYVQINNVKVRRFDYLLVNDTPYIDESLKVVGHYKELLTKDEIDDPEKAEIEYSQNEALNSVDLDDYDENDMHNDFDPVDDVVDNLL